MTITYELYSPEEGPYLGVIPKEYVTALGGETYKYASPMSGGGSRRCKKRTLRKKNRKTRVRKSRRSFR